MSGAEEAARHGAGPAVRAPAAQEAPPAAAPPAPDAAPEDAAAPSPRAPEPEAQEPAAPVPSAPAPVVATTAPATGRARLRAAMVPRATRAQLLTGGLCLLLGLAVAVQVRQETDRDIALLPQSQLVGLLADANDRNDRLQREITDLEQTRTQLQSSGDQQAAARQAAQSRLDALSLLAGTVAATGPGITLTITLPDGAGSPPDVILLDAVEELRDAGAEAIAVDGVRVVASTSFVAAPTGGVVADGRTLRSPYVVQAIGDAQTLASAMDFPEGVVKTVAGAGGEATVVQHDVLDITALKTPDPAAYAHPVQPDDSSSSAAP